LDFWKDLSSIILPEQGPGNEDSVGERRGGHVWHAVIFFDLLPERIVCNNNEYCLSMIGGLRYACWSFASYHNKGSKWPILNTLAAAVARMFLNSSR
jgi:hypothetical protein